MAGMVVSWALLSLRLVPGDAARAADPAPPSSAASSTTPRQVIARAVLAPDAASRLALVRSLAGNPAPEIRSLLTAWREDALFLYQVPAPAADGTTVPITLDEAPDAEGRQAAFHLEDGRPLTGPGGEPVRLVAADLTAAEHDAALRGAMKTVLDLQALGEPDPGRRLQAIATFGFAQDPDKLAPLRARQEAETDPRTRRALREAVALIELKDPAPAVRIAACRELAALGSIPAQDALRQLRRDSGGEEPGGVTGGAQPEVARAADQALARIAAHVRVVDAWGTAFRGLSLGSILLVVAIGLGITFGLMGVINMAHGEMMAVGAYTTYVVQNLFADGLSLAPFGWRLTLPGWHATGWLADAYFVAALPLSFLTAALVGMALERGVIRFLYRRPYESLLATWGISLLLQQGFRLVFGANNVPVGSPRWLSGHWTVDDVSLGWNRLFVVGFAAAIVVGVRLLLTRTSLGLLIRAVMQNRPMADCLGVGTERVYALTFALGSGLAGLAGAFLSQVANVGPSLGQSYIVDAFMTVVVGGVGNLAGTLLSALGIGLVDQSLQQVLGNPVLGKILVLAGIILFLQWRPAGLFVARTRALDP